MSRMLEVEDLVFRIQLQDAVSSFYTFYWLILHPVSLGRHHLLSFYLTLLGVLGYQSHCGGGSSCLEEFREEDRGGAKALRPSRRKTGHQAHPC